MLASLRPAREYASTQTKGLAQCQAFFESLIKPGRELKPRIATSTAAHVSLSDQVRASAGHVRTISLDICSCAILLCLTDSACYHLIY